MPVRRTAFFIEMSTYRGTKWAASEPNAQALWEDLRISISAFIQHGVFRKGSFQGSATAGVYLVKVDSDSTTQWDIEQGMVNIVVGFAVLKPAEFVIIRIQQQAGQPL